MEISVRLSENTGEPPTWTYAIGIKQRVGGNRQPYLSYERVWHRDKQLLKRPNEEDLDDRPRRTQTHLEQINSNAEFRDIARFFESILYLHLVPQLVRHPEAFSGPNIPGDPFGRSFLERVARATEKTRKSRLKKIGTALKHAVPQLKDLSLTTDERGVPHLEAVYEHWRPNAGKQREDQFSDGTLRLIALLWSLLEGESPLLLEEPELSLNSGIVTQMPAMMYRLQRRARRQILVSTHSADLLSDKGIGGEEVLLLTPGAEGTTIEVSSAEDDVRSLLDAGFSVGEAALPRATPNGISELTLFE